MMRKVIGNSSNLRPNILPSLIKHIYKNFLIVVSNEEMDHEKITSLHMRNNIPLPLPSSTPLPFLCSQCSPPSSIMMSGKDVPLLSLCSSLCFILQPNAPLPSIETESGAFYNLLPSLFSSHLISMLHPLSHCSPL